mgnify:CR=1 FL=1
MFHIYVGLLFSPLFIISRIWMYKINSSNIKSTYQYLLKTQLWGYWIGLFSYSMIIGLGQGYFTRGVGFMDLIFPVYLIITPFYFFKVYKQHFSITKQKLA